MAKDDTAQAKDTPQAPGPQPETFIVVNGTLVHDGRTFPVGAEFHCDDAETAGVLLACRAIARPEDAMQAQVTQTLDENSSLKTKVRDLERQLTDALASLEKRERVI